MKILVVNQARFSHIRSVQNKALRQSVKDEFDVSVRRMDNFTLTGLAAVAKLNLSLSNTENVSLISCAQYFSVELVQQLIIDGLSGKSIRPLDFVATVGNAANFYIAKEFAIHGSNLFLGADKQTLEKTLMMGALELASHPKQQVVIVLWQETQTHRNCQAMLLQNIDLAVHNNIQTLNIAEITDAIQPDSPFVLDLGTLNSLF